MLNLPPNFIEIDIVEKQIILCQEYIQRTNNQYYTINISHNLNTVFMEVHIQ